MKPMLIPERDLKDAMPENLGKGKGAFKPSQWGLWAQAGLCGEDCARFSTAWNDPKPLGLVRQRYMAMHHFCMGAFEFAIGVPVLTLKQLGQSGRQQSIFLWLGVPVRADPQRGPSGHTTLSSHYVAVSLSGNSANSSVSDLPDGICRA